MTHKKVVLCAAVFSIVGVLSLGSGVYAHDEPTGSTEAEVKTNVERTELAQKKEQMVRERKTALQDKVTAAREERKTKLESKRLELCQKRQNRINSILAKGTEQSRKHLAVFQKIEERVKLFYANKHLSADGYDAAVAKADEKEAAVIAAIEASTEQVFDCTSTDGAKPADEMKSLMKARHEALKEYRTAVKDLILVVKKGHGKQQNATEPAEGTESGEEQ